MSAQPEALFDEALRPLVIPLPAPIARTSDPDTSKQAAAGVDRLHSKDWVVGALIHLGPSTDEEIAAYALRQNVMWKPSRLRTARKEACDRGLVQRDPTDGESSSGNRASRWRAIA